MAKVKWTLESCQELASLCKTKKEFKEKFPQCYQACYKHKIMDQVSNHMIELNNLYKKDVYFIKGLDQNIIYIGISTNPEQRYLQHKIKTNNFVQELLQQNHELLIIEKGLSLREAVQKEKNYIIEYTNLGWKICNKSTGR